MSEEKKAKFIQAYSKVPEELKSQIIVVIDDKPYTWDTAYLIIEKDDTLARKILKTLEDIKII